MEKDQCKNQEKYKTKLFVLYEKILVCLVIKNKIVDNFVTCIITIPTY